jgi:16S rRNA (adenine1518-N6/adenine1519-N6)-dimethyltransferase
VARAIVEAAPLGPRDLAVEIGPGHGVLTFRLAAVAGRVLALEVDPALVRSLVPRATATPNLDLRQVDALAFDFRSLRAPDPGGHVVVVANLPYAISKPLLFRLFEARGAIQRMVLMLQREVAERLTAEPGGKAYGVLSVAAQLWADVTPCFTVPASAFSPPPKVESAVVRIVFRTVPKVPLPDEKAFLRIVKAAFGQRRKKLGNALHGGLGLPLESVRALLESAGIDPSRRGESLSLEEFARLTQIFLQARDERVLRY